MRNEYTQRISFFRFRAEQQDREQKKIEIEKPLDYNLIKNNIICTKQYSICCWWCIDAFFLSANTIILLKQLTQAIEIIISNGTVRECVS